jgi:hypothetical protein
VQEKRRAAIWSGKNAVRVLTGVRDTLHAPETRERFRTCPTAWTRHRLLPFDLVVCMILRAHKLAIQNGLNKLFAYFGNEAAAPTPSAYCKARKKLDPKLFQHLIAQVAGQFYAFWGEDNDVRLWHGRRLLAVDGSRLHVPDTPETRAHYSVQENQYPQGTCVQAAVSVCYDVLNEVALSVGLREVCAEKEFLWGAHDASLEAGDLVVLDRGYQEYAVLAWLEARGCVYVVRCARRGAEVERFWASEASEAIVRLRVTKRARPFVAERGLASELRVRLVKVTLSTGETEVLATNLGSEEAEREGLKDVYGQRWGIETFYDRVKNVYEAERISGRSVEAIEQDVYGVVFLATLESIVGKEAEQDLAEVSEQRGHRYAKQVNHAVSYSAMVEKAVALLCDERAEIEDVYDRLRAMFRKNPTSVRPGRTRPRKEATPSARIRHHRFRKRIAL